MKIFFFIFSVSAFAQSYSFMVKFHPLKVNVSSPREDAKEISLIVENTTLGHIWGKLLDSNGNSLDFLGVPPSNTRSIILKNYQKGQTYYFVSDAPPFQKIVLKSGLKDYEIPPSK